MITMKLVCDERRCNNVRIRITNNRRKAELATDVQRSNQRSQQRSFGHKISRHYLLGNGGLTLRSDVEDVFFAPPVVKGGATYASS